ncbi:MAG: HAD family phosphatase [Candidatus Omnitrophica bacterium]|nr:HAD family phosphatase [Candidatus Omnitrophota bacterium]
MSKLKNKPKAIIFDMDGVIVDSMPYHFLAWYEALRPWGVRVNCFDVYSKEGERWEKTLKSLLTRYRIIPTKPLLKKIFQDRQRIFRKNFKRYIFRGAPEIINCLRQKGYSVGLVTGTPDTELRWILSSKIRMLFDGIVAGNEVKKGKPHPEPYLKAARILGVSPSECVVIENAPFGIASAKSAGMTCIAVTTSLPKEYLKAADIVLDELSQITAIVERSCRLPTGC